MIAGFYGGLEELLHGSYYFQQKVRDHVQNVQDNMVDGRAFSMSKVGIDAKAKKQHTRIPNSNRR